MQCYDSNLFPYLVMSFEVTFTVFILSHIHFHRIKQPRLLVIKNWKLNTKYLVKWSHIYWTTEYLQWERHVSQTRMHSSRMHTTCSSSCLGGGYPPGTPQDQTRPPWDQVPPRPGTPLGPGSPPRAGTPRPGTPLWTDTHLLTYYLAPNFVCGR